MFYANESDLHEILIVVIPCFPRPVGAKTGTDGLRRNENEMEAIAELLPSPSQGC
jgi:hypothetical protein